MSKSTKTMKATKVTKATKKAAPKKKVVAKRVADTRKNVNSAKAAVAKVIKKQAAEREAKKKLLAKKKVAKKVVAKKKAVAKKKSTKETLKQKYTKLYKIVSNYSDNLMQDVYSVVYRKKELKRFINTALAMNFIEQEVLIRLNEHAINTAKKSRALAAELASEFE